MLTPPRSSSDLWCLRVIPDLSLSVRSLSSLSLLVPPHQSLPQRTRRRQHHHGDVAVVRTGQLCKLYCIFQIPVMLSHLKHDEKKKDKLLPHQTFFKSNFFDWDQEHRYVSCLLSSVFLSSSVSVFVISLLYIFLALPVCVYVCVFVLPFKSIASNILRAWLSAGISLPRGCERSVLITENVFLLFFNLLWASSVLAKWACVCVHTRYCCWVRTTSGVFKDFRRTSVFVRTKTWSVFRFRFGLWLG